MPRPPASQSITTSPLKSAPKAFPTPSLHDQHIRMSYEIARGEQGVLTFEPYKSILLPHWRFRSVAIAEESSKTLKRAFDHYVECEDFVGSDMARKFIQMGMTRARRCNSPPFSLCDLLVLFACLSICLVYHCERERRRGNLSAIISVCFVWTWCFRLIARLTNTTATGMRIIKAERNMRNHHLSSNANALRSQEARLVTRITPSWNVWSFPRALDMPVRRRS